MKKNVTRKIIFLNIVVLLLFTIAALSIILSSSQTVARQGILDKTSVYSATLKTFDSKAKLDEFLEHIKEEIHITMFTTDGNIVSDNQVENLSLFENVADIKPFSSAVSKMHGETPGPFELFSSVGFQKHETKDIEMVYSYSDITLRFDLSTGEEIAQTYIFRIGQAWSFSNYYVATTTPVIIAVLLLLILISNLISKKIVDTAVGPIKQVNDSLEGIIKGQYNVNNLNSKYPEVKILTDNIKQVSSRISGSLKYLNYEQKKSNAIMQSFEPGLIALGEENKVVLINYSAQEIFQNYENGLGKTLDYYTDHIELREAVEDAKNKNDITHIELNILNSDFRVTVCGIDAIGLPSKAGMAVLILFYDITIEKQNQKIRNEFFANASHELRSPLTAIKGFAEIAETSGENPQIVNKCVGEIDKNATKMLKMINNMLKLGQVQAKIFKEEPANVNLRLIVEDIRNSLESKLQAKRIKFSLLGDDGILFGRKMYLEELVQNLIDNAIKYNIEGGKILVKVKKEGRRVILTVEDSGIGIPFEHQKRIFESYYRVDKSRNRKSDSTGLGLSIVKSVVDEHHGSITIESKVGIGTKFTIELRNIKLDD